jgi:hypothetical protein
MKTTSASDQPQVSSNRPQVSSTPPRQIEREPTRVIASEHTAVWMERFASDLPGPTDVLD